MMNQTFNQAGIPGQPTKAFDLIGFVIKRAFLILPLGAALILLLSPSVLILSSPFYETSGRLLITRVMPGIITNYDPDSVSSYFREYARTQVEQIRKVEMMEEALTRLGPAAQSNFVPLGSTISQAAARLNRVIEIDQVRGTHLLEIKLRGSNSESLAELVNALMDVYLERKQAEQEGQSTERLNYLLAEKKSLESRIAAHEKSIQDIASRADIATFNEEYNPYRQEVITLQMEFARLQTERIRAENELRSTESYAEKLSGTSMDAKVEGVVAEDESLFRINSWTYQTMQTMRASLDGMSKENPDRRHVEERMAAMGAYLEKTTKETTDRANRIVYGAREYDLKQDVLKANHSYESARSSEEELAKLLPISRKRAKDISLAIMEGAYAAKSLQQLRERVFLVERRMHDLTIESKAPLRLSVERYARRPSGAAGNNAKKFLMLLGVLCFGFVGVCFFGYDVMDDRIRTVGHVRAATGSAPIRPVSIYEGGVEGSIPFARVTLDDRTDDAAKSMRSIALRLILEWENNQSKVATFSGVTAGAGVSDIVLNVAHALRQSLGRVLVVECACREHSLVRYVRGIKPAGYIHNVVNGEMALSDAVICDSERGIDVLGCMPGEAGSTFVQGTGVTDLLASARQSYDFVLLAAPPVLDNDFTEFVVSNSDVTVMLVETDYTLYRELRGALEMLIRLEVPAIATVLNHGGHVGAHGWRLRFVPSVPWPLIKRTRTLLESITFGKIGDFGRVRAKRG